MEHTDAFSADLQSIQATHFSIRSELSSIKRLTQPLLHRKATSDKAAPGSYNTAGALGTTPALSVYSGAPKSVFGKAELGRMDYEKTSAPAPGSYSPSLNLVLRNSSQVSFGSTEFTRWSFLKQVEARSPGPVYIPEAQQVSGGRISPSKRDTFQQFLRNDFPSPQTYNSQTSRSTHSFRFGSSGRSDYLREYRTGIDRLLKGKASELTTTLTEPVRKGSGLLKSTGHIPLLNPSVKTPGVGTYSTDTSQKTRGKFSFPRADRRTVLKS